jgi:hypothetical protein
MAGNSNQERFPWQNRLDGFLRQYVGQLGEADARLVFRGRAGDDSGIVKQYLLTRNFSATVGITLGQKTSVEDGVLSEQAVEAIFGRARNVFTHNKNPPHLWRGRDVRSLYLRMGDRLATLPGSGGEILEDALVEMARVMGSIYSVYGAYGPIKSCPYSNIFEYLKNEFNGYGWALPFPVVEALFNGEKFDLEFVYDEINGNKDQTPETLDLAVGDPLVIVAYSNEKGVEGYEPYEGTGFKITNRYHILPLVVTKVSKNMSEREPLVCVHIGLGLEKELLENRYEVRVSSEGRLYVADFARYGGKTWASVGPWSDNTENIPDHSIAYQILKPVEKLLRQPQNLSVLA